MFLRLKWSFSPAEYAQAATKLIVLGGSLVLTACTPELNWREAGFDETGAVALMPCKPEKSERMVSIAGQTVQMQMRSCKTAGALFALTLLEVSSTTEPQTVEIVKKSLSEQSRATHQKALSQGTRIVHAAIAGQPKEGSDGPGAFSNAAVEQFLGSLSLAGAK